MFDVDVCVYAALYKFLDVRITYIASTMNVDAWDWGSKCYIIIIIS